MAQNFRHKDYRVSSRAPRRHPDVTSSFLRTIKWSRVCQISCGPIFASLDSLADLMDELASTELAQALHLLSGHP